MSNVLGWGLSILTLVLLIWQLVASAPLLPPGVSAILLVFVSVMTGIRIGVNGTLGYIRDVHRLNKVLAEQHRELEEVNASLLQQLTAQAKEPETEQNLS